MRDSLHASSPPGNSPTLPTLPVPLLVSEAASRSSWADAWAGRPPPSTLVSYQLFIDLYPPLPQWSSWPPEAKAGHRSGSCPPHRAIWARPSPSFSSLSRLIHELLMKGVKPSYQKMPETERNPAFSAHLSPMQDKPPSLV